MTTLLEKIYRIYETTLYHNFCTLNEEKHSYRTLRSWEYDKISKTEEDFEKNYGNPLANLYFRRVILKLDKNEDKISMKIFSYFTSRGVGKKFFKKETVCKYLTYNMKTNILYSGEIYNYHLKRNFRKKLRNVNFQDRPIQNFIIYFYNLTANFSELGYFTKNDAFETLNLFLENIPGIENYLDIDSQERLYKLILDKRGIKLPNNWLAFRETITQPKKNDYKKNNFKYIDTFMSINKLSGDKIKRVLHQVNSFNINSWNSAISIFGEEYIKTKNDNFLRSIFETSHIVSSIYYLPDILNKRELDNAFEIFKLSLIGEVDMWTFVDHIRFCKKLKEFGENIKWNSKTYTGFNDEHSVWTDLISSYTKGNFERIYNQNFINTVNNEISLESNYYPVVLTTSKEYNEESAKQSNCVRTYIERPSSLIISLRKNSIDSNDRATIEYYMKFDEDKKIKLERIQTLGKFNQALDSTWDVPLQILDKTINEYIKNYDFDLPKLLKETKKGTFTYQSKLDRVDSHGFFNGYYYLNWDNDEFENCTLPYIDF